MMFYFLIFMEKCWVGIRIGLDKYTNFQGVNPQMVLWGVQTTIVTSKLCAQNREKLQFFVSHQPRKFFRLQFNFFINTRDLISNNL